MPRSAWLARSVLLFALAVQCVCGAAELSLTNDEVSHLPAGVSYWKTRDFRMNPQHPPLVKLWCALPLLAMDVDVPLDTDEWRDAREWGFGQVFFERNGVGAVVLAARCMSVLLGLLLAFYAGQVALRLGGPWACVVATALAAFSPDVVAHARYVTTDVAAAAFAMAALHHALAGPAGGLRHVGWTGVWVGAALAAKFSGVVTAGVVCVVVWAAWKGEGPRRVGAALARVGLGALLVLWASYLGASPLPWWNGLMRVNADRMPGHAFFLDGTLGAQTWTYFPLASAYKTPLPEMVLALAGAWAARHQRLWPLWLMAGMHAASVCLGAHAMGVRYLMPVHGVLFALGGASVLWATHAVGRWAVPALCAWMAWGTLRLHPDPLAFFNALAGGEEQGHLHLDDSNLDWGDGLVRLRAYMDAQGLDHVRLMYPWTPDPRWYGIRAEPVSPGELFIAPLKGETYVLSVHVFIRRLKVRPAELEGDVFGSAPPDVKLGNGLWVWHAR